MNLKKLLLTSLLISISITAFSQHRRGSRVNFKDSGKKEKPISANYDDVERVVEIGIISAYQFGGKFYSYYAGTYGDVTISDGTAYGITASFPVKWNTRAELSFQNQETSLSGWGIEGKHEAAIRYYQLGVVKEFPKGKMIPYGAFSLGAVELNFDEDNGYDTWKFAITLGGGLKYYFNRFIGIKLEAKMLVPISYGGLYIGTGGSGVSAGSTTIQGYVGGGLTFALTR